MPIAISGLDAVRVSVNAVLELITWGIAVELLRTPDECFENLAGYPWAPNYLEVDGVRNRQ